MNKYVTKFRGEVYFTPSGKLHIKDEPVTPIEEDFGDHNRWDLSLEDNNGTMRKSMSLNDIAALKEVRLNTELDDTNQTMEFYRRCGKSTGAPHDLTRTKFVSMAEAIYHYQRDTPGRFHSKRPQIFRSQVTNGPSGLTIPQSPMLRSKARSRPTHIMSQKEREELEVEEIKKFKLKANPIPKSVLEGTKNLPEVPRKPCTVPAPFKLTEIQKKLAQSPEHIQNFKARPAPKHILDKPHIPPKPSVHTTKPVSPKFHYKPSVSADNNRHQKPIEKHVEKPQLRQGPLKPEPFSFQKRDEELKRRHEERIQRQIEEERKQASQFKAKPIPSGVKKHSSVKGSASTTSSENKENFIKFEARPPVVLYKEPFKPILQAQVVKSVPFELATVKRAAEREKFDKLLKEKEEALEWSKKLQEKQQQEMEEKDKAELRSKLVHHAKPILSKTPFVPEKSVAPLTVPETPKFVRRLNHK